MPKPIDVYHDWLGIKEAQRPLNHYQLLRLKPFEDDPGKVREHYRKMYAHVRKFAAGDYAQQSQALLNELSRAMLLLTDAQRKREYDASLGRKGSAGGRRTLEEILLARQAVDAAGLAKARNYANAVGVEVRDALLQQRLAAADVVMPAYAESVGLPYLELGEIELSVELLKRVPAVLARQHSCAPVMIDDGTLLVASPNVLHPTVEDELRLRVGMPVRCVLCSPADIHSVVNQHYPKEAAAAEMAGGAVGKRPEPAPKPQPAAAPAAADAESEEPEAERSAEEIAARRQRAAIIACAAVGGSLLVYQFFYTRHHLLITVWSSIILGMIAAGAAWLAMTPRKR